VSQGGDKDGDTDGLKKEQIIIKKRNAAWPIDGGCGSRNEDGYCEKLSVNDCMVGYIILLGNRRAFRNTL